MKRYPLNRRFPGPLTSKVLVSLGIDHSIAMSMIRCIHGGIPETTELFCGNEPSLGSMGEVLGDGRKYGELSHSAEEAVSGIPICYGFGDGFYDGTFFARSTFRGERNEGLVVAGYFDTPLKSIRTTYSDQLVRSFVRFSRRCEW